MTPRRFSCAAAVTLAACVAFNVFALSADTTSALGPEIAVFFWHRKGSPSNRHEYDPKFPARYERLELDEWSPDGWAPGKVDIILQLPDEGALARFSSVRTTISMRVGPLALDSEAGVTDVPRLEADAVWLPAHSVHTSRIADAKTGSRLILVQQFDLERLTKNLWKANLWPIELKFEAVLEPLRSDHLRESLASRTLRLQPGD